MTEKWLNETVESVVNAMKLRRMKFNKEKLFNFMYENENIYQIVLNNFCSEKKARLIIREIKEICGERESVTNKSIYPLGPNYSYARRSKVKNHI